LQARVIRPAIPVEPDLRAAGGEHAPFVFVGLFRGHARELVGIEWDPFASGHVDSNRSFRIVEPGVTDRHEKTVLPLLAAPAVLRDDEINRTILVAIDDDPLQPAGRPVPEIEDVDRRERPTLEPIEVSRSHEREPAIVGWLIEWHRFTSLPLHPEAASNRVSTNGSTVVSVSGPG
jgi:hypothetical protein